ncbi:MAG: dihydropteroate synthase [Bacteroidetes bacterium 43-93]|nr:dihydropteroate synthase [Bacteroidota bacterium]OJW99576.1 MAG: dihydropteroate synthase [Bacteroidetes bacterium 43-93]
MSFKNTVLPVQTTLQSRGLLLDLSKPIIMGILNATPDSFYNKGRDSDMDSLLRNAEKMISEGASILDIGGASTKPGAKLIPPDEELGRVIPAISAISKQFPDTWLSVDTYNAVVAREAIAAGAHIINDISSGGIDNTMIETVASLKVPYIAMHMQGLPETMQNSPQYNDVTKEVVDYLRDKADECRNAGIADIIVDPGFGFGKTQPHNYELLRNMHALRIIGKPILAGLSRKGMIWRTLGTSPDEALNGTTALHMVALQQGANILRVHDVKEAMEVIRLYHILYNH